MTQPDEVTTLRSALRDAEAKLSLLRDAMPHVVYMHDLATERTDYLSRHLGSELGYDEHEIEAMGDALTAKLVHPDDYSRFPELKARWMHVTDGEVLESEYRALHKDGSYRYFLGRDVAYERDADQRVVRCLGTAMDVTERKLLEQRLSQAEKLEALGRLASGVAHDFNNLVAVVLGSLSLVERQLVAGGSIEGHLAHVRAAAEQAASVTSQLLDFARPGLPSPAYADLAETIAHARPVLERILAPDVTLEVELSDVLLPVAIAPNALVPVLVNLVVNARDAIAHRGTVTLRARVVERTVRASPEGVSARKRYVLLTLEDDGDGIPKHVLPHIFEPFFTTKTPNRGTGLGLATVYNTIHRAGGEISVDSEPGSGTRFDLYLPVAR
jgi:two-component system cell cycle sensor histidine kinase/response regulator CckA